MGHVHPVDAHQLVAERTDGSADAEEESDEEEGDPGEGQVQVCAHGTSEEMQQRSKRRTDAQNNHLHEAFSAREPPCVTTGFSILAARGMVKQLDTHNDGTYCSSERPGQDKESLIHAPLGKRDEVGDDDRRQVRDSASAYTLHSCAYDA